MSYKRPAKTEERLSHIPRIIALAMVITWLLIVAQDLKWLRTERPWHLCWKYESYLFVGQYFYIFSASINVDLFCVIVAPGW